MIYVDVLMASVRSGRWPYDQSCHMFADTDSELHLFAAGLGLRRAWFQAHKRLRHYDLTAGKRAQAIRMGAKEVDAQFVVDFMRRSVNHPIAERPRLIEPFRKW